MKIRPLQGILASCLVLAVVACGGSKPPAEAAAPSEPAATPPETAAPPPTAPESPAPGAAATPAPGEPPGRHWDTMSDEQKKEVMKTEVVPRMKALFGEFDAKRFPDVKCTTCHGASAMTGKFDMPNPNLPKLDPANMFEKHKKKDAKIVAFMMERVVPEMAKIINEPVYDPTTNEGFGCTECHIMAGKK